MSRREVRERKVAEWIEHLEGWKASGESLSAYARRRGLPAWSAYQWRRRLVHNGLWRDETGSKRSASRGASRVPLRFARVAVTDAQRTTPLVVRIQLANGRRVEIALDGIEQLGDVLSTLEQPA